MKTLTIHCPYCNAKAVLSPAETVFGRTAQSKGKKLYVCANWPRCDSYVSAQKNDLPMGTLANHSLRRKRILAHRAITAYAKLTGMDTWASYLWLQGKLNLPKSRLHIGQFNEFMCNKVIAVCNEASNAYRAEEKERHTA